MNLPRRAMIFAGAFTASWVLVEAIAGSVLARYSPFQVVWTRYAVHLLILVVAFGWQGIGRLVGTKRFTYQICRSLLMLIMPASWIAGRNLGMSMSGFMPVFWLSPLLVMLFASWHLGERPGLKLWLAGGLASAGAILQFGGSTPSLSWQLLFPLAMAASFSFYIVMTRSLREESVLVNLFYTALGVFVALSPMLPGLWKTPAAPDLGVMVMVGFLGLASLYFLDRMASTAPVSQTAPVLAAQVLLTTGASALLGHSLPGRLALLGGLAVAVSVIMNWQSASTAAGANIRRANDLQGSV